MGASGSTLAADGPDGTSIAVWDLTGPPDAEPRLLHNADSECGTDPKVTSGVWGVAVSPDGQSIASGSRDGTIRIWPMPHGRPFHTLPHEELLDRLRGLTNLRVVEDPEGATGYRVEAGSFPGWATIPSW